MALERLQEDARGDLVYTFTKPWSDGTTGITLSPVELLEKLSALVPLTRVHLARLTGIPQRHISEMEHGKRPIGKERTKKLAEILKVDYHIFP